MRREVFRRLLPLWVAFGIGSLIGSLITSHYLGKCDARLVEVDTNALTSAAVAALPAAMTGGGAVSFTLNPLGIRVHADSLFQNQSYDTTIPAVIKGPSMTIEVSTQLLRQMLGR